MKLTKVVLFVLLAIVLSGCGSCEKLYDKANYESITNETGALTLWSGGKIMAVFYSVEITYSAADSDAMYFKDIKGSTIMMRDSKGEIHKFEGKGDNWYTSPGVLMKLD